MAACRSSSLVLVKLHRRSLSVDVVERRGEAQPRSAIWFATAKRDFSNASGDRRPATSGAIGRATFLGRDDIAVASRGGRFIPAALFERSESQQCQADPTDGEDRAG